MNILNAVLAVLLAYLLGSIPSAVWIGKRFHNIDVREHGSGNAGTTNTIRVLGWKTGIPVLFIDIAKGWLAAMLPVFFHLAEPWKCSYDRSSDDDWNNCNYRTYFSCFCRIQGRKRSCNCLRSFPCSSTSAYIMLYGRVPGSSVYYRNCICLINECRNILSCFTLSIF